MVLSVLLGMRDAFEPGVSAHHTPGRQATCSSPFQIDHSKENPNFSTLKVNYCFRQKAFIHRTRYK